MGNPKCPPTKKHANTRHETLIPFYEPIYYLTLKISKPISKATKRTYGFLTVYLISNPQYRIPLKYSLRRVYVKQAKISSNRFVMHFIPMALEFYDLNVCVGISRNEM